MTAVLVSQIVRHDFVLGIFFRRPATHIAVVATCRPEMRVCRAEATVSLVSYSTVVAPQSSDVPLYVIVQELD